MSYLSGRTFNVLVLGVAVISMLLVPKLSTSASARSRTDPQVVAAMDIASLPGSRCTILLIANPGKPTQYTKYQSACGPGAII